MKFTAFLALAIMVLSNVANADILFQLSPANQQITKGSTALFNLRVISSILAGEQVDGLDANVVAGVGNGTGGVFVAPTASFILGNGAIDIGSTPGQAFHTNVQAGGVLIPGGAGVKLSDLYLDTTGVTPGIYQMTLSDLAANSPISGGLTVVTSTISYEVIAAAIPEPTSILSTALIGLGGIFYRRRS